MEGNQMLLELPWSHTPTDSWCVNTFEENSLSCKELFWELFVTPWVVFQCVCLLWEATTPYCRRKGFHLQKSWRMFTSIISTTSGSLVWISDRRIPPPVHLLPKLTLTKTKYIFLNTRYIHRVFISSMSLHNWSGGCTIVNFTVRDLQVQCRMIGERRAEEVSGCGKKRQPTL